MKVFLHIGAHRTGTSSLQACLAENLARLGEMGFAFWGPPVLRDAPFTKIVKNTRQAKGDGSLSRQRDAIRGLVDEIARSGRDLIVSDENICGTMTTNIARGTLYHKARQRMRIFSRLFAGHDLTSLFTLRETADYWLSCYGYMQKQDAPDQAQRTRLALASRAQGWAHVVTELRRGQVSGDMHVLPYKPAHDPRDMIGLMISRGKAAGLRLSTPIRNARPSQRRASFFDDRQLQTLAAAYEQDLEILRAPADEPDLVPMQFDPLFTLTQAPKQRVKL
jgi:hypothetical protein